MPRRSRAIARRLAVVLAGLLTLAPGALAGERGALPLGPKGLEETRSTRVLAGGVTATRIDRGRASAQDAFTVDVAFLPTRAQAEALAGRLGRDGYAARVERVAQRAPDDPEPGPLGYLVRTGSFAVEAEAIALRDRLTAGGYAGPRVVFTGEDGGRTTGPWVVHLLEIDPRAFPGTVFPALGSGIVPGREPLTGIATRTGALAAVTGGYFVIGAANGTDGDLAGVSVIDGGLVSEAVDGRTSLVLPDRSGEGAFVSALATRQAVVAADGATREVDGLNRAPGLVRGCGGSGGDQPTEAPKHDFTCTDASELILFTPAFGATTEPGAGVEVALDAAGLVNAVRAARGGAIATGGRVLSGTGEGAGWLRSHAAVGQRLTVSLGLEAEGGELALGGGLGIVNGGPRLLRSGRPAVTAFAEGFHWPESPEFFHRFGLRRNPRTLAGVTADGRLLLVVVDGRRPGFSVGASFAESARILRALGARDGVNLDGGGSSALTIGSELVNRPSDATGERPLGDALVLAP